MRVRAPPPAPSNPVTDQCLSGWAPPLVRAGSVQGRPGRRRGRPPGGRRGPPARRGTGARRCQAAPAGGRFAAVLAAEDRGTRVARIPQPPQHGPARHSQAPDLPASASEEEKGWGRGGSASRSARGAREPCAQTRTGRSPLPGRGPSTRPVHRRGRKKLVRSKGRFTNFEEPFFLCEPRRRPFRMLPGPAFPVPRGRPADTTEQRRSRPCG
jgi:hypothetical protein